MRLDAPVKSPRPSPVRLSLAVAALVGVAACGSGQDGTGVGPAAPISTEAQQILDTARADVETWYGTLADRHAAEIVVAGRRGAAYESCMRRAGHDDADWRDTVSASMWREPVVRSFWLVSPAAEVLSADLYALQSATMYARSAAPDAEEAHERCRDRAGAATAGDASAVRAPAALAEVDDDFTVRIQQALAAHGSPTEFVECVEALDADVLEGEHLDHVFGEHAHERVTAALVSEEAAAEFRAWELRVNAALWECSGPTFEEAVRLLPAVVDEHAAAHRPAIGALGEHWRDVRDEAADLWNG